MFLKSYEIKNLQKKKLKLKPPHSVSALPPQLEKKPHPNIGMIYTTTSKTWKKNKNNSNSILYKLTTKNFNSEQFLNCPRRPIPHDLALALLSCFLSLSTCLWMIMMWRLNKLSSHWKLTINAWVHRWGTTNSGWCSGKSWLEAAAAATWVCVRRSPSPAQWYAAKNVNKKIW